MYCTENIILLLFHCFVSFGVPSMLHKPAAFESVGRAVWRSETFKYPALGLHQ
jgi:hypothetical protein